MIVSMRFPDRELMLFVRIARLYKGMDGREFAIAQVIEEAAVRVIAAGFGQHIDDRAAGASQLRAAGI